MTIALAGVASMIGAGGLGKGVWRGLTTSYGEMIFLSSFLIAVMAGSADWILGSTEKYINFRIFGIKRKLKEKNVL
jgi:osmoprotectant transport system permease protein